MKAKRRLRFLASAIALVLVGLVVLIPRRHEQLYKVTVLPSLGTTYMRPTAINDRGQVVGFADIMSKSHLFLWDRDNGMKDLGPIDIDNVDVDNVDINNAGQIAGTMIDPNGFKQAFLWDPNDGIQLLGTLGGIESFAMALNNRGQVVGFSHRDKNRPEAFIWDKTNGMRSLAPHGQARAINDVGHVLGEIGAHIGEFSPYPTWMSCYWDSTDPPGTLELSPNGYLGGSYINNNGYVLRAPCTRHTRQGQANWVCLWHKDAETKWLFPYEGHIREVAFNDANQILYYYTSTSRLARLSWKWRFIPSYRPLVYCLWDSKRGKVVLHDQVPREIGNFLTGKDINNRGCIVGVIRLEGSGQLAGVMLEPIPERWGK